MYDNSNKRLNLDTEANHPDREKTRRATRPEREDMSWIDKEYPNTAYAVEVKYSGDIAIATCRTKGLPEDRDTKWGFTSWFWCYEDACKYARKVAKELNIAACI